MIEFLKENIALFSGLIGTFIGAIISFISTLIIENKRDRKQNARIAREKKEDIYYKMINHFFALKHPITQDDYTKEELQLLKIRCYIYGSKQFVELVDQLEQNLNDELLSQLVNLAQKELGVQ